MMKRVSKTLIVFLLIALVFSGAAGCAKKEQPKKKKPKPIPSKTVGLRQPIAVGSFAYQLLSSQETTIIGRKDVITSSRAKGRFIILNIRAELVANRPRTLDRREILVVDSKGKVYQSSQDAQGALTAAGKRNIFKQDTTYRGIPVTGWVAFDVDKKAKGLRVKIINLMDPKSFEGYFALPQ